MADDKNTAAPKPTMEVETVVAAKGATSFEAGSEKAVTGAGTGLTFEAGQDKLVRGLPEGDEEQETPSDDAETPEGEAAGEEDAPETEGDDTAPEPLPDFDLDNEDVVAKYDAKYITPEGKLDVTGSLSEEFWANYDPANPSKPGLGENTYKYLEERFGLDRAAVIEVEQGQVARQQKQQQEFYQRVGGKARYEAAVNWGRANYTPEQQAAFNAARQKGGTAFDDAVDALLHRYGKVAPQQQQGRRGPPRRPSTPSRDATGKSGVGGSSGQARDVFASAAEYNAAIAEARKSGDAKKVEAVRAKGKRSRLV